MKKPYLQKKTPILVVTFYSFTNIIDTSRLSSQIHTACKKGNLLGTAEISTEGINCSLAGTSSAINRFLEKLKKSVPHSRIKPHFSRVSKSPFRFLKIKIKNRLIYPGKETTSKHIAISTRASPSDWDTLLTNQNIQFLDTRNSYEYRIGSFIGAHETKIDAFSEFANFIVEDITLDKKKPIAIFCTGGIRCEKASVVLDEAGFEKIIQLEGGILRYLSESKHTAEHWRGDCFVFDSRVALNRNLEPSDITQCPSCRIPLTLEDREQQDFEEGISCRHCRPNLTRKKRLALTERKKQRALQSSN